MTVVTAFKNYLNVVLEVTPSKTSQIITEIGESIIENDLVYFFGVAHFCLRFFLISLLEIDLIFC